MNIYLLPLVLILVRWVLTAAGRLPWSVFDPFLALVAMYAFFHGFEARQNISYALYCGLIRDLTSLDTFGLFMFVYLATALAVALFSVIVNRQSPLFVFPVIFVAALASSHITWVLAFWLGRSASFSYGLGFFGRALCEAVGTTLFAYPLYHFSRRCALTLTA
jgi:rod shape-determining protein MreD